MATPRMDITSFVGKLLEQDDVDALREGVRVLAQAVMETEVSTQIGAAPYERSSERVAYRNGYRTRRWDTRVGTIELKIPKGHRRRLFPEPARTASPGREGPARGGGRGLREVDLHAQGRRPGASARIDGISRSEVSRICKSLDTVPKGAPGRRRGDRADRVLRALPPERHEAAARGRSDALPEVRREPRSL